MNRLRSLSVLAGLVVATVSGTQAQDVVWAERMGGTGADQGYGIAVDAVGTSYVTGNFNDTADFGSYTLTPQSYDVFVEKLDGKGTVLWAERMGGVTSNDGGFGIAADADGNSWVTGRFSDTADFGSYTLT